MISWIVIGAGVLVLLGVVSILLQAMWRILRWPLIGVSAAGLALLIVAGSIAAVTAIQEEFWLGAVAGGLVSWVAFRLLLRLFGALSTDRSAGRELVSSPIEPPSYDEARWSELSAAVRWHQRHRVAAARQSIAAFVAEGGSPSLSADHHALMITLKRRVPELIAECLKRCSGATGAERRAYLERALATLEAIAADAEVARKEVREADDRELEVLHHYFGQVSEGRSV